MNRDEFDHGIRAAASILGVDEVLVIGSQAIRASVDEPLPEAALRSVEVDVAAMEDDDGGKADLIDGAIGEASIFHESFGFYVQGVVAESAILPQGWRERLIPYSTPATGGVVAQCLEIHDLWISKAIAGRPKDREFCRALLEAGQVDPAILVERMPDVDGLDPSVAESVTRIIAS
jgi:hypothetical protein